MGWGKPQHSTFLMRLLKRFFQQLQVVIGVVLVALLALVAIFAPTIAPKTEPTTARPEPSVIKIIGNPIEGQPQPPSAEAPFGTTKDQYDIYTLVVWGTRSAFRFGLIVTLSTATLGILLGALSGYVGGWFNGITMRITDALLAFPLVAGVWLLTNLALPRFSSVTNAYELNQLGMLLEFLQIDALMLGFILFSWMPYARLMNVNVQTLKRLSFIQAAEALGAGTWRVVWKHLIPNAIAPVLVLIARDIGGVVILGLAFAFIQISPADEWSAVLLASSSWIVGTGGNPLQFWWTFIPATLFVILFGMSWNLLGDGVNVLLNPRKNEE
jgi:peptide/nickel transport system permease protein